MGQKQHNTSSVIHIDTNLWTTQTDKAKQRGCSKQYISELIRKGKLKSWRIDQLGLHLVER